MIMLSHYQAAQLLRDYETGTSISIVSPNLNKSNVGVSLSELGTTFPGREVLTWNAARLIATKQSRCFVLRNGELEEIALFSDVTNWARSLYPTSGAPTTLVAVLAMHRIKGTDSYADTLMKIRAASPVRGRVLDTAT